MLSSIDAEVPRTPTDSSVHVINDPEIRINTF